MFEYTLYFENNLPTLQEIKKKKKKKKNQLSTCKRINMKMTEKQKSEVVQQKIFMVKKELRSIY